MGGRRISVEEERMKKSTVRCLKGPSAEFSAAGCFKEVRGGPLIAASVTVIAR